METICLSRLKSAISVNLFGYMASPNRLCYNRFGLECY